MQDPSTPGRIFPGVKWAETRYPFDLSITPKNLRVEIGWKNGYCAFVVFRFSSTTSSAE